MALSISVLIVEKKNCKYMVNIKGIDSHWQISVVQKYK